MLTEFISWSSPHSISSPAVPRRCQGLMIVRPSWHHLWCGRVVRWSSSRSPSLGFASLPRLEAYVTFNSSELSPKKTSRVNACKGADGDEGVSSVHRSSPVDPPLGYIIGRKSRLWWPSDKKRTTTRNGTRGIPRSKIPAILCAELSGYSYTAASSNLEPAKSLGERIALFCPGHRMPIVGSSHKSVRSCCGA